MKLRPRSAEHETLIVVGSAVRHWARAIAAHPRDVIILSPFVTSGTAEAVLRHAGKHRVKVYTVFESRLFASGASQISTLKRLVQDGHRLFHLPGLHAKVVLTKSFATIGSQNLTGRGQLNREATAVLHDPGLISSLRSDLRGWLSIAKPISMEQITKLERALPPLRRTFRGFEARTDAIDEKIADHERVQRERTERLKRFRALLQSSERSAWWIDMRLVYSPYETLLRRQAYEDLTSWPMPGGKRLRLDHRRRYLLVSPTGCVAWPALNKTRMTQFGSGLINDSFRTGGKTIQLSFSAVRSPSEGDANVELELRLEPKDPPVRVRAWFDLEKVELRGFEMPKHSSRGAQWIGRQLERRKQEMLAALAGRLLRPFRYSRNRLGLKASQFLGASRRYFRVRLYRRRRLPFLVVE